MDAETLVALHGSIKKWEAIAAGTGDSPGAQNCPLCAMFNWVCNRDRPKGCKGCPVQEATGLGGCVGTPYQEYEDAEEDDDDNVGLLHDIAVAEVDFLKSLLPSEPSEQPDRGEKR
jgi:hypothetical protein